MNLILLSGGSGKRLWPLSNDIRSKQFIKIFKNKDGQYESMLQRMYKNIKNIDKDATITLATSKTLQIKDPETGKIIAEYDSQKAALEAIGKAGKSGIGDALNGRTKTHVAYGFKWYFKNEYNKA